MRLALALLLMVGCAKKSAETPAAAEPPPGPSSATTATPPTLDQRPREQQAETGSAPKGNATVGAAPGGSGGAASGGGGGSASGSAIDEARASGVLGPTDQHVFAIKSSVSIKRASTKQVDTAAKTSLEAVKACYDKALEFQDTLAGELTLTVKNGKATVAKSTLKNPELEKCVAEALTTLPSGGKATLVLAFKRG
jgi:hypothetical protein